MDELTRFDNFPTHTPAGADPRSTGGSSLVDVLERVLDKGVVIAGDVRINLLDIELLTIKVRLLIASADKAKEMGIDWWAHDPHLSSKAGDGQKGRDQDGDSRRIEQRLARLESQLEAMLERLPAPQARGENGHGPAQRKGR